MSNDEKKYERRAFIRLAALTGVGFYLNACNSVIQKKNKKNNDTTTLPKIEKDKNPSTHNVTFYKKEDPQYEKLRKVYNKRIQKYPAVIAVCKNIQGIVEAMQYAKQNNLPIAIKSGGHCFEGFSSNNDGLIINLSLLKKVEWINDETIKVQPACTLSNLYDALLPKQKIIPAGSCGSVGIGGLTLGGGYGFFSRKYGLTCDSLVEVAMVDGEGKIHNSKNDPELLWACKGGGNGNFGVVAEMIFKTQPAPKNFQSHRFKAYNLNTERATNILQQWFQLTSNLPTSCFSAFVLNGKTLNILITDYENHTAEIQNIQKALSPLMDKTSIGEPKNLALALRNYYGAQDPPYFKNASAGLYKSFEDIKDCIHQALDIVTTTPGMIYQINTLGGNIQNDAFKATAAYPHRDYLFISELQTYWENTKQAERLIENFKTVQNIFSANGITTQYANYPSLDFKNWETAYYGENYSRLQKVKNKYDADNLIRHEQSVKNS